MEKFLNKIINDDALKIMFRFTKNSIPLIVTSPPYNLRNTTAGSWHGNEWRNPRITREGYDGHNDAMPRDEYIAWQRQFLTQAMEVLTPDGALFYVHKWRSQNKQLQTPWSIIDGFPLRQIIIWQRSGGHNFNRAYFLPTTEQIYLIAKPQFKLRKDALKWGDVWKITQEKQNPHPAPFPLELARRCIDSTDAPLVLDPFAGSGTTAIAASTLKRDWICIEKSPAYCQMAQQRIAGFASQLMKP